MNLNRYFKSLTTAMLVGTPFLWTACTDTWSEHYDAVEGGMAGQATLLENIAADPTLSNFYKVVKAIKGEDLLRSPSQLTVWAPTNLSDAQADSVIAVYEKDVAAGMKWEDNRAVTQFLYNHLAMYARTISPSTNDTVSMRNRKYMHLVGNSLTSGTLSGNPFSDMVLCNNGLLYKTERMQNFFPNVREFVEHHANMDSLATFLKAYDEYSLDEEASTPGGVIDGKTVYLDSVTTLYNRMLNSFGFIQREDSVYTFLAPTDELWKKEYDTYSKYYVYNSSVNNGDSLQRVNTISNILQGRFFNTSPNWRYNRNPKDSLCNTWYTEHQEHNPREDVYYKPEEGILKGLEKNVCSNGVVYVDDKGMIDPHTTFFGRSHLPAYYPFYYEVPKDRNNVALMNVSNNVLNYYTTVENEDGSTTEKLSQRFQYVEVTAKTSSAHTNIEFKVPNTLSNVYYNVYLVTVPTKDDNSLPCWFQVAQSTQNDKGTFSALSYFTNPHQVTAGSVPNADVILKQGNNQRCFVTNADRVDTILVQSGVKYDFCGRDVNEGVVRYTVSSFGPSGSSYREKIYTRTLRLNQFILVPFATKEEAEAAADNLDAFNDALLEANKEN